MARIPTLKSITLAGSTYLILTCPAAYAAEQIFVPLTQPCRLIDTRLPAPGTPFTHESRQDFLAWSDGTPLTAQGGDNCELPRAGAKPSAIAANITAVAKKSHSIGNLLAYPFTGNDTASAASLINFSDNNVANASVISLNSEGNKHFSITGNIFNTTGAANSALTMHAVVDVTGYFYEATGSVMNLKNVVTVSQQGDGFTDPIVAMASITDASSTNPYLLYIGPGNYNLTQALEMNEYVTIEGAGVGQTILHGNGSNAANDLGSSVMIGADHATVTHLTLSNIQGVNDNDTHRRGIINKGVSPTIEYVEFILKSLDHCVGILNEQGSTPIVTHTDIDVSCNNTAYGFFNFQNSTPVISYSNISVTGGVVFSEGIQNNSGTDPSIIRHSTISGSKVGIRSKKGGKANISFSTITGGLAVGDNPDNDNDSTGPISGAANLCGHSIDGDTNIVFDQQCL